MPTKPLKICFMGGQHVGVLGLLGVLARRHEVVATVSSTDDLTLLIKNSNLPLFKSIKDPEFERILRSSDLLLSVHGKEIVPEKLLSLPRYGAINIHPYLYKYKGARPVQRAIADGEKKASIGAHWMVKEVDAGEVIFEKFIQLEKADTVDSVYNVLYQHYPEVIVHVLKTIEEKHAKS